MLSTVLPVSYVVYSLYIVISTELQQLQTVICSVVSTAILTTLATEKVQGGACSACSAA